MKSNRRSTCLSFSLTEITSLLLLLVLSLSACDDDSVVTEEPYTTGEAFVSVSPSFQFERQTVRVTKDTIFTAGINIPVKDAECHKSANAFTCSYNDTIEHISCRLMGESKYFSKIPCEIDGAIGSSADYTTLRGDNWMHFIPDATKISDMSIAGTHDSDTFGAMVTEGWSQTQELDLREQFDLGVRLFDIRPSIDLWLGKWFTYDDYSQLYNYHGYIRFDSIRKIFATFLDLLCENPHEAIFVILNYEGDLDDTLWRPKFSTISEREGYEYQLGVESCYLNLAYFIYKASAGNVQIDSTWDFANAFRPGMTMGDCRGKMTFIFRDEISPDVRQCFSGPLSNDVNCPTMKFSDGLNTSIDNPNLTYYVQDKSTLNNEADFCTKDTLAAKTLDYKQAHPEVFIFNYLSGFKDNHKIGMNIPIVAHHMNSFSSYTMKCLAERDVPSNFVLMDFAGVEKQFNNAETYTINGTAACRLLWLRNFYHSSELISKAETNSPIYY